MNKKRLREVAERIAEYPEFYDQDSWFSRQGAGYEKAHVRGRAVAEKDATREQCGTTACIAGEACVMYGKARLEYGYMVPTKKSLGRSYAWVDWEEEGRKLLGLTAAQADRLFCSADGWPEPFASRYLKAKQEGDHQAAACVAAERIKHFIDTNGEE